ncbi:hypothetical protein D3C85_975640 [compost metagenome]
MSVVVTVLANKPTNMLPFLAYSTTGGLVTLTCRDPPGRTVGDVAELIESVLIMVKPVLSEQPKRF